jgi:hypothetical protein
MKRLHEAITEAQRLSRSQPLDDEWLGSLFENINVIASFGNAGVRLLIEELFPPKP